MTRRAMFGAFMAPLAAVGQKGFSLPPAGCTQPAPVGSQQGIVGWAGGMYGLIEYYSVPLSEAPDDRLLIGGKSANPIIAALRERVGRRVEVTVNDTGLL